MKTTRESIDAIRKFNRYYTNVIGLLETHILESEYSLTEARILFELNERQSCFANELVDKLTIDKSYLSKVLKKFEKNGLIQKEPSKQDSRAVRLKLTEKGQSEMTILIGKSNRQIAELLKNLEETELTEIVEAMSFIQTKFEKASLKIRGFRQENKKYITDNQIMLYQKEYHFTTDAWRSYINDSVDAMLGQFEAEKDQLFILEKADEPCGCIAIAHTSETEAQLRFFFVEASLRGQGAGKKLINEALDFCKEKGYSQVILWTISQLETARHLYRQAGFELTETHTSNDWGQEVLEEKWVLTL